QAWLYLAADGRTPNEVELEAEQLLEVQAALLWRPSNIHVEKGSAYCYLDACEPHASNPLPLRLPKRSGGLEVVAGMLGDWEAVRIHEELSSNLIHASCFAAVL